MNTKKRCALAIWILTAIAALAGPATTVIANTDIVAADADNTNIGLNTRGNK